MSSTKKTILNIGFLILCFGLTMYYVFHGEDVDEILKYMKSANSIYWIIGVLCVILFIGSESLIIHYLLKTLNVKIRFFNCFLYSCVGFFFCCVTPSASGGQPAQALFMKKDNIPFHISTVVLLMVTITYKMVLLIYGILVIIFRPPGLIEHIGAAMPWVYLGIVLNFIIVSFMLILAFRPTIARKIIMGIFYLINKIFRNPKVAAFEAKLQTSMDGYVVKSEYLLTHKLLMLKVLGITFIQRTILFLITYLVCISFGGYTYGVFDTVVLQGMIAVAVDMLPLPGGMGISEHLFMIIFQPILGRDLTVPAMIVSRGISYYTQLIISVVMTGFAYIKIFGRKEKNDRIL